MEVEVEVEETGRGREGAVVRGGVSLGVLAVVEADRGVREFVVGEVCGVGVRAVDLHGRWRGPGGGLLQLHPLVLPPHWPVTHSCCPLIGP